MNENVKDRGFERGKIISETGIHYAEGTLDKDGSNMKTITGYTFVVALTTLMAASTLMATPSQNQWLDAPQITPLAGQNSSPAIAPNPVPGSERTRPIIPALAPPSQGNK